MEPFSDYYEALQVSPNADFETLERVYRLLAKRYHPDNQTTGNDGKFRTVMDAYNTLSDPEKRASYDASYQNNRRVKFKLFEEASDEHLASFDKATHLGVLSLLYTARRHDALNPGMGEYELGRMLNCPEKHMDFHLWYLKSKGWVERTDSGQFAITVDGVDAVIAEGAPVEESRLLPATGESQADAAEEQASGTGEPSSS